MSATEAPPSGSRSRPHPPDPGRSGGRAAMWVAVALAGLVAFVVLTWPLALHPDHFWTMAGNRGVAAEPNFVNRPGGMHGCDHLQNVFIQSVVVDNLRALRNPYLDLREGAAGPSPPPRPAAPTAPRTARPGRRPGSRRPGRPAARSGTG